MKFEKSLGIHVNLLAIQQEADTVNMAGLRCQVERGVAELQVRCGQVGVPG